MDGLLWDRLPFLVEIEPTVEHVSELIVTTSLLTAIDRRGLTYKNIEPEGRARETQLEEIETHL